MLKSLQLMIEGEAAWTRSPRGFEERTFVGKFGQSVVERRGMGLEFKHEYMPNSVRRTDSFSLGVDKRTRIIFPDPENKSQTSFVLEGDFHEMGLNVLLHRRLKQVPPSETEVLPAEKALVRLVYTKDGVCVCALQAQEPPKEGLSERDAEDFKRRGWQENIDTLLTYLRSTRQEDLEETGELWQSDLERYSRLGKRDLGDFEPIVEQAMERVHEFIPADDKEDVGLLFRRIAFRDSLMSTVLDMVQDGGLTMEGISVIDVDGLINTTIESQINQIITISGKDLISQSIILLGFEGRGLYWQEVEREVELIGSKDDRKVLRQGKKDRITSDEETEIELQGNTFIVNIAGNEGTIGCLSSNKEFMWIATFPITISFDAITRKLTDPDSDFSQIRQYLYPQLKVF